MKKLSLLLVCITLCTLFSCQTEQDDFLNEIENASKEVITENLLDYKGLKVNHRFSNSLITKKDNLQSRVPTINNDQRYFSNSIRVINVVELILRDFPYNIDSDFSETDMNMIRNDFPFLTDVEIANQMDIIEDYYSENLLIEYKLKYDELYGDKKIGLEELQLQRQVPQSVIDCVLREAGYRNNPVIELKARYALSKSDGVAEDFSLEYYPENIYAEYDTKRDAFRHMMWNAMLAQYYFTITSKNPRINFAKAFTDAWELSTCKEQNLASGMNMDLHNNHIGRHVWSSQARYASYIFWVPVGLSTPTRQQLADKFNEKIESSKYIDVAALGVAATVSEINATPASIVVYISRPAVLYNIGDEILFERNNGEFNMLPDSSDGNFENGAIPREYFIKSIDDLGIQVGDTLHANMRYKGSVAVYNGGANGFDGFETITMTYNGEATVLESLGNNEFLIGFTDPNRWNTISTTQETSIQNWQIDFYEVDYNAKYIID